MKPTENKLLVLIPVFNGGDLLLQSINSCGRAGLEPDEYDLLVVDNCSTDGAVDRLPAEDANGAAIHVVRNATNLGRIGNWNRAVEIAAERGYSLITFLFIGDVWIPASNLGKLLQMMNEQDAAMGMAPFAMAKYDGTRIGCHQRFQIQGSTHVTTADRLLANLLSTGIFPLGPLQANIYRIKSADDLKFDPAYPRSTDTEATIQFLGESAGKPVVIFSDPFLEWRENPKRFQSSISVEHLIHDLPDTYHRACIAFGRPEGSREGWSLVLLNTLRAIFSDGRVKEWVPLLREAIRHYRSLPCNISPPLMCKTVLQRYLLGKHLVYLQ
jgi:hypothetical protein